MSHLNTVPIFGFLLISSIFIATASAATFTVKNNCPSTVWAAAVPGGGKQMATGDTWIVTAQPGQTGARIWARTGCTPSGSGLQCQTGDCGGVLQCTGYGTPPNTLAEYALDQFGNNDFFDISLVDGFNVPMTFLPVDNGCTSGPTCRADVNAQCPSQLKAANGGCNNPCTVFKTDEYCCNSGSCGPTNYSMYFKNLCPTAYSYPKDDATSTFTCPTGTNYAVTFCP